MRVCSTCARPLKSKYVTGAKAPVLVAVCKSPVCKRFGKPQ